MSNIQFPSSLVNIAWLQENLEAENLVILDASVPPIMPFTTEGIPDELAARHIPGALRFDYDTRICDQQATLPHMMPTAEFFADQVSKLGIGNDSAVLIYDNVGVYASPRAWWMFKAMGHDNVAVLDGGSFAWYQAGLPLSSELAESAVIAGEFTANQRSGYFCDAIDVYQLVNDESSKILDARSAGRFYGRDPEPRENLRGGHIPGSLNLPFQAVLNDTRMKSPVELGQILDEVVGPQQKLVFTCGSGLSACVLALAADLAGVENLAVYDGSWCEWGQPGKLPVATQD